MNTDTNMIKQMISLGVGLLTLHTATTSFAVTATDVVNITLTAYSTNTPTTNPRTGTLSSKVTASALNSKMVVEALGGSPGMSLAQLTTWGAATNGFEVAFDLTSVIYSNLTVVGSNSLSTNLPVGATNVEFLDTFSIGTETTNALVSSTWTNTTDTGTFTNVTTNALAGFPGYSNVMTVALAATNQTPVLFTATTSVFALIQGASVAPLAPVVYTNIYVTNNSTTIVVVTNSLFSITLETNAIDEFNGSDPRGLVDDETGASYSLVRVKLSTGTIGFSLAGFDIGAVSPHAITSGTAGDRTTTYYSNTNQTISVVGKGYMATGFAPLTTTGTNGSLLFSNVVYTLSGETPVLIKGAITTTLRGAVR